MVNVRSCTITRQVTLYLANHANILMGEVLFLCKAFVVLNLLKFVPREFLSFVKTERFLPPLVRALFFNEPSRKSA